MKKNKFNLKATKEVFAAIKKLQPYLFDHKKAMVVVLISMLVSTAIAVSMGFGLRFIFDRFPSDPVAGSEFLNDILVVVISIIVIFTIVNFISSYVLQKVAAKISEKIRCDIFSNIITNNLAYIESQNTGDMQTRIVADTNAVSRFLTRQVPIILGASLSLLGGVAGALLISVKLTFLVVICAPVIFLPVILFSHHLRRLGQLVQTSIANVGRYSGEVFRNIKIVKAYNKEDREREEFSNHAAETTKYTVKSARLSMVLSSSVSGIAFTAAALLFWQIANDIYHSNMTVGQFLAFVYFARLIIQSAQQFVGIVTSLNTVVGQAHKVLEFIHNERLTWDSPIKDFTPKGTVEFNGVSFNYPSRPNIPVLKGIFLRIEAGQNVAIVGPSGAGKSTLFDLLLRLYDVEQGTIVVDGHDYKDIGIDKLRSFIGLVPQKESLISGTVLDNISYGSQDAVIDESLIVSAAKKAHADEFIEKLPNGYNTDIGEIGGRLSGGQKQRLALARALIRNPQILLLDEANSALDSESDKYVSEAIRSWSRANQKTVVTIAHRLSSVQHADSIIVMDNGMIVDQGTHEELLTSSEVYKNLVYPKLKKSKVEDKEDKVEFA